MQQKKINIDAADKNLTNSSWRISKDIEFSIINNVSCYFLEIYNGAAVCFDLYLDH